MKLFVGNLSFHTTVETLKDKFSNYGTVVSANIITDRETGRSRGFGFVEMSTDEEGQAAISGGDGSELDGRTISVNEAREKSSNPRSGGGGRGGYGGGGGYRGGGNRY